MSTATPKESRVLTIEGELVRVQRIVTEKEIHTADFMQELSRKQTMDSGLLPDGCVWFSRREDTQSRIITLFVIERPPTMQTIRFREDKAPRRGNAAPENPDPDISTFKLSWPNTLWFVRCVNLSIHDVHVVVTGQRVRETGYDTPLKRLLMPNQYEYGDGAVCMGTLSINADASLPERVEEVIRLILESTWNSDLIPVYEETGVDDMPDWDRKSQIDPEYHRKMKLVPHRHPTFSVLRDYLLNSPI